MQPCGCFIKTRACAKLLAQKSYNDAILAALGNTKKFLQCNSNLSQDQDLPQELLIAISSATTSTLVAAREIDDRLIDEVSQYIEGIIRWLRAVTRVLVVANETAIKQNFGLEIGSLCYL